MPSSILAAARANAPAPPKVTPTGGAKPVGGSSVLASIRNREADPASQVLGVGPRKELIQKPLEEQQIIRQTTARETALGELPDWYKSAMSKVPDFLGGKERGLDQAAKLGGTIRSAKRLTEIPLDTITELRRSYSEFKPIVQDLKTYIQSSEPTTPSQDLQATLQTAERGAGALAKGVGRVVQSFTKGFKEAAGEVASVNPSKTAQVIGNAASLIDQTLNEYGTVLHDRYQRFNQVQPDASDYWLGVLSGGTKTFDLATMDAAEVALGSVAGTGGVSGAAAEGLGNIIEYTRRGLSDAVTTALQDERLNFLTPDQKREYADSIASIATMGIAVKGIEKGGSLGARVLESSARKLSERATKGRAGTTDANVVASAVQDALIEAIGEQVPTAVMPKVRAAQNTPLDKGGIQKIKKLKEHERFAFESETAGMIGDEVGKLGERAAQDGFEAQLSTMKTRMQDDGVTLKTEDIPFEDNPATFDPRDNSITFNYAKIREHLDYLANGETLIYGTGKQQFTMQRKPNESFEDLSKRYLDEIYEHEVAHAKTISPEDIVRLREAEARGDKNTQKAIIQDLEERAHRFVRTRAEKVLGEDVTPIKAAVQDDLARLQATRESLKELRYSDEYESGYQRWKKWASRQKGRENAYAEDVQKSFISSKRNGADTPDKVNQLLGLERKGDFDGKTRTPDDYLAEYQARFQKEMRLKQDYVETRSRVQKLREEAQPSLGKKVGVTEGMLRKAVDEAKAEMKGRVKEAKRAGKKEADIRVLVERGVEIARRKFVETRLKEKLKNKLEAQKEVQTYLREIGVDRQDRWRYTSDILAATPETLGKKLERIDREYSRVEQKRLRKEIKSKIEQKLSTKVIRRTKSGVKMSNRSPESIELFNKIKDGALNKDYREAFNERAAIISEYRQKNPQGDLPDEIVQQLDILSTYGIKNQTVSQLERTVEIIDSVLEEGKIKRRKELQELESFGEKVRGQVVEASGISPTNRVSKPNTVVRKLFTKINDFFVKMKSPEFLADYISQKGEAYSSAVSEFFKEASDRKRASRALTMKDEADLGKRLHDAYKVDVSRAGQKELTRILMDNATKEINLGKHPFSSWGNKDVVLTKDQMITITGLARNEKVRARLLDDTNGFTEGLLKQIEEQLSPQDKAFLESMFEAYREKHVLLDETSRKDTGVPAGYISDSYLPLRVKVEDANKSSIQSMLHGDPITRESTRPGALKERKGTGKIDFDYSLATQYVSYAARVNYYSKMWDYAKTLDRVFTSDVLGGIEDAYGKAASDGFKKFRDDIKRGGLERLDESFMSVVRARNRVARALLNSPLVVAGQFSSTLQFMIETPSVADYAKGMASFMTNPLKIGSEMLEKSVVLRDRYDKKTFVAEATDISKKAAARELGGASSAMDFLDLPLETADKITTVSGYYSVYTSWKQEFLKRGKSPEDAERLAIRKADNVVERTQSSTDWLGKSQLESNFLGRLLVSFKNAPIKMLNAQIHAIMNWKRGRISAKDALKTTFVYSMALPALYTTLRYETAKAIFGEEDEKDLSGEIVRNMMMTPLTSLPYVGDLASLAVERLKGNNYRFSPSILMQPVESGLTVFGDIGEEKYGEATVEALRAMGLMMGVPYSNTILREAKKSLRD